MNHPNPVNEYLSVGQAARALDVSSEWVRRLIERGELRSVSTTLGWLIEPESVSAMQVERERSRQEATHVLSSK